MRVNFDDGATAAPSSVVATPLTQTIGHATTTGKVTATAVVPDPGVNNASLKYQWYQAPSASTTIGSTLLAGETSSTLTPATNSEGTFYYYVVVSNSKAPTGVTSNNVTVIVGATSAPSGVSVTPSTPQEVDQGHAPTPLSATVANTGGAAPSSITYQWYSRTTDSNVISGATQIPGANTPAFLPQFDTPGVLYYFCVATNSVGSTASNTVKVEIKRVGFEPPVIGTNITMDGIEWIPIRQVTEGGKTYTLIVSRQTLFNSQYKSTANFMAWENPAMVDGSLTTARTNTNNWYAALDPTGEIRSRAMVPTNVRSEAAYATTSNPAQGYSAPTAAKPTSTADVAFALSFSEANDFMTATQRTSTAKAPATYVHWWLRSPANSAAYARLVTGSNGLFDFGSVASALAVRPALWIE